MARLSRLVVAGQLHLLTQRAHDAAPVFRGDADFESYRRAMSEAAREQGVAIHAYALVPDQVWLLLTPSSATALSRMWQSLGRRFGADYNRRHGRRGALWEGRFRTTVVDVASHLVDCCRFVEWAPVRAGLSLLPQEYPWSSAAHHTGLRVDGAITEHPRFWSLGNTPFEREANYRRMLEQPLPAALQQALSDASLKGWAFGSAAFVDSLTELSGRRASPLPRGRPKKIVPT
jgi:putative transposase